MTSSGAFEEFLAELSHFSHLELVRQTVRQKGLYIVDVAVSDIEICSILGSPRAPFEAGDHAAKDCDYRGIFAPRVWPDRTLAQKQSSKHYTWMVVTHDGNDWIKGDNTNECVAYMTGWVNGRLARVGAEYMNRLGASSDPEVKLAVDDSFLNEVETQLSARSALMSVAPRSLRYPAGDDVVTLTINPVLGACFNERIHVRIDYSDVGMFAAGVLGMADGLSKSFDD